MRFALSNLVLGLTVLVAWPVAAQTTNDLPVKSVVEAGSLIDAVGNTAVRSYLQRRLDDILARPAGAERNTALEGLLVELRAAVVPAGGGVASSNGTTVATPSGAGPVAPSADRGKDVELINLLTQYACLLLDLEGRGYDLVRGELENNLDLAGSSADAMGLVRQLVLLCDEAERAARNSGYIAADIAAAEKSLYWQNLGTYGASSLISGNPLPLLKAAAAIVKGRYTLAKEKDRKLDIEIQNHRGRLANFLFELGVRRANLKAASVGEEAFVTKEGYAQLQEALAAADPRQRAAVLTRCVAACPALREAVFCLAVASQDVGEAAEAERRFQEAAARESRLLCHDGLRAAAYDRLAEYAWQRGDASNTLVNARLALQCDNRTAGAYNHLALAFLRLGDWPAAYSNLAAAVKLDPMNGHYLWTATRVAAARGDDDLALTFLRAALANGFHEAAAVNGETALARALATPRGQRVLQPPLSAACDPQLLNHRFAVSNMAGYALTGLVVNLTVRYEVGERGGREQVFSRKVPVLPAGGEFGFALAGPPKGDFRCRMQLDYQCADYPGRSFRTVNGYNMDGKGGHEEWSGYLLRRAQAALQDGDRARREEGFRIAVEAAEWTAFEDVEVLAVCAKLAVALGNEEQMARYSAAARRAMFLRPLLNSVQVEAAVKRLGEGSALKPSGGGGARQDSR